MIGAKISSAQFTSEFNKLPEHFIDIIFVSLDKSNVSYKKIVQSHSNIPYFIPTIQSLAQKGKFAVQEDLVSVCNEVSKLVPMVRNYMRIAFVNNIQLPTSDKERTFFDFNSLFQQMEYEKFKLISRFWLLKMRELVNNLDEIFQNTIMKMTQLALGHFETQTNSLELLFGIIVRQNAFIHSCQDDTIWGKQSMILFMKWFADQLPNLKINNELLKLTVIFGATKMDGSLSVNLEWLSNCLKKMPIHCLQTWYSQLMFKGPWMMKHFTPLMDDFESNDNMFKKAKKSTLFTNFATSVKWDYSKIDFTSDIQEIVQGLVSAFEEKDIKNMSKLESIIFKITGYNLQTLFYLIDANNELLLFEKSFEHVEGKGWSDYWTELFWGKEDEDLEKLSIDELEKKQIEASELTNASLHVREVFLSENGIVIDDNTRILIDEQYKKKFEDLKNGNDNAIKEILQKYLGKFLPRDGQKELINEIHDKYMIYLIAQEQYSLIHGIKLKKMQLEKKENIQGVMRLHSERDSIDDNIRRNNKSLTAFMLERIPTQMDLDKLSEELSDFKIWYDNEGSKESNLEKLYKNIKSNYKMFSSFSNEDILYVINELGKYETMKLNWLKADNAYKGRIRNLRRGKFVLKWGLIVAFCILSYLVLAYMNHWIVNWDMTTRSKMQDHLIILKDQQCASMTPEDRALNIDYCKTTTAPTAGGLWSVASNVPLLGSFLWTTWDYLETKGWVATDFSNLTDTSRWSSHFFYGSSFILGHILYTNIYPAARLCLSSVLGGFEATSMYLISLIDDSPELEWSDQITLRLGDSRETLYIGTKQVLLAYKDFYIAKSGGLTDIFILGATIYANPTAYVRSLPFVNRFTTDRPPELLKIEQKKEEPPKLLEAVKIDEPKQIEESVKLLTNTVPEKEKEEEEEEEYVYLDLSTFKK